MKSVRLTAHAQYQMKERNVSKDEIENTLRSPIKTTTQSDGRIQAVSKFEQQGKTYLRVVIYEETPDEIVVITTFITSKINKYS